jgi:hypothetical protein
VLNPATTFAGAHFEAFPHLATLHRNKRRGVHRTPVPYGHPLPRGPCVDRRPTARAGVAPEVVTRFSPKEFRDYGTRDVYMKHHPGHGTSSLKELVGVEVRQTYFPSVGRRTKVGISQPPWKRRWGYLERRARARISLPLRLPSMLESELFCYLP